MKEWINKNTVDYIGRVISLIDSNFKRRAFIQKSTDGLDELELKDRIQHLISALHVHLPSDFIKSAEILQAVPAVWNPPDEKWAYFAAWPLIDYVGIHGIDNPDYAFPVLKELTPLFSAEFAIRPFIERHWEKTNAFLCEMVNSSNEHHRRLVSEGTRPRLPWGRVLQRFVQDPSPAIPFLNALVDDTSLYVRKSVANHLNDISKDNPECALKIAKEWLTKAREGDYRKWVVNKGVRSLIKAGYGPAFNLLGYSDASVISVVNIDVPVFVPEEGSAVFKGSVLNESKDTAFFVLDYIIHYKKANGSTSPKVFKLKDLSLAPGERYYFSATKHFNTMTTRKHYPGEHFFELQINGKPMGKHAFLLH